MTVLFEHRNGHTSFTDIKQLLMYPKEGQGRLNINTEDYVCLGIDQFLNDKILDFYLKYLWENLPSEQKEKVHIFSTFFYKRLTTKATKAARKSHPYETDPNLSAAEKRHWRVRNWTKKINLFEKDFVVVPINENAHWFLAIICFPSLQGPETFDGKSYNPEPRPKKKKVVVNTAEESKKEKVIPCDEAMASDKDEAESDDSDLDSDDSDESATNVAATISSVVNANSNPVPGKMKKTTRPPIKQPCILIFDSLSGPSRSRVVATLRDYLTVEYKVKHDTEKVFNKDTIKGSCCKVPQQNNFTDCGLYVLQYVENFFKEPITDFNIPVKGINDWFDELTVTRKREDICNLLKGLIVESGGDTSTLPDIALPTQNGQLIDHPAERDPETGGEEEDQEDMFTDIEDAEMSEQNNLNNALKETPSKSLDDEKRDGFSSLETSPIKPSDRNIEEKSDIVTTTLSPTLLKPSLSGLFPRQTTNKDTLNYLKSKRIVRNKPTSDGPENSKKLKLTY